jgi:hypothetical protein
MFQGVVRLIGIAVLGAFLAPLGGLARGADAAAPNMFSLDPSSQTVDLAAGTATVNVKIQDATNINAFQFVLRYDPGVLVAASVVSGPFLAGTGRSLTCVGPTVDGINDGLGTVLYGCASGAGPGVGGNGALATVTFHLAGGSATPIAIEQARVSNADGQNICTGADLTCSVEGGSVTVTGGSAGANQGVSSTPTPGTVPADTGGVSPTIEAGSTQTGGTSPTPLSGSAQTAGASPTPAGDASGQTPAGGLAAVDPASGQPLPGDAGAAAGAATGSTGAGSGTIAPSGAGAGVGRFGYGPQSHGSARTGDVLGAAGLVVFGLLLFGCGGYLRMRVR